MKIWSRFRFRLRFWSRNRPSLVGLPETHNFFQLALRTPQHQVEAKNTSTVN